MSKILRTTVDTQSLDRLLGLESSKIGFYSEVKQKIQELEAANLGLRTKSRELQAVFDAISDGVVIYDSSGSVQYRNHVCPRMFPVETTVGSPCSRLFHPGQENDANCPVHRALTGESVQISFTRQEPGAENGYYDVTVTPIEDHNGEHRALMFLRDVTDRRIQELQLMQAEKMSSIGVLAAGVAHEINNPLASVAGYAEALVRRLRNEPHLTGLPGLEDFERYLGVIVRETYRCKGIIDNLLNFSRKSDGCAGAVDVNQAIREVLELVRYKSRYEQIEVVESLQEGLPPVYGDEAGLRQVFMNLLLNAHQAIAGAGVVEIATLQAEGMGMVQVRDSGCGIAPEQLAQIWNPFFTTKTPGGGLGLGLAITYNIVQRQGGTILVESQPGKGSTFTVRLPLCQG